MSRIIFIVFCFSLAVHPVSADSYSGNKILEILGEDRNGEAVREFKTQFILDKSLRNPALGIKLTAGHDSGSVITAVTLTAAGCDINDIKYKQFAGALPFDISFNDDANAIQQKFKDARGPEDDIRLKFKKDGITVNIYFKTAGKKKIMYIKFTQNIGSVGPYRIDGGHDVPVASLAPLTPEPAKNEAKPNAKTENKTVASLPTAATFSNKSPAATARASEDPFYNSIMNVIESGEEEMFKDIKKAPTPKANFWNYKYTYSTSVSIPGEKYNMLYSFPFQSSQLDFVSVLAETDGASPVIQAKYAEVESKLKADFKPSEGWTYSYTVNPEDPNGPKDLELRNPKLGSIVLDYSINPYGKHVLYLRFLLQYT